MYGATKKFNLDVWSMSNFTYPGKLTYKLLSHMMKLWSLRKDRVLALNALQRVTVGLQCVKSFSLLTQKGSKYSSLLCAFLFKSVADICHFLSFDLFRMKPLELNYKEYHNNMYFICYHISHTFSTVCYKHKNEINTNSSKNEYLIQYRLLSIISNYCSYTC